MPDGPRQRARLRIAALAVLVAVAPYLPGLLGACVLYVACRPGHDRLAPRLGPRTAAIMLAAAAAVFLVVPGV